MTPERRIARRPKYDEPTVYVHIRQPESDHARVLALAKWMGMTVSSVMVALVRKVFRDVDEGAGR